MKSNLRLLLMLPMLALFFVACEKANTDEASDEALIEEIALAVDHQAVEPSALPADARLTLEENHFETYVEEVFQVAGRGFEIRLGNGEVLFCNDRGRMLEYRREFRPNGTLGEHPHGPCYNRLVRFGRPVRPAVLPQTIQDYVATNYPDNVIRFAKLIGPNYLVLVNVPVVLRFDLDGNFLGEVDVLENCRFGCNPQPVDQLPAAISAYITANFPNAENIRACRRAPGRVLVTFVSGDGRVVLGFDADGNLIFQRP